MPNIAARLFLSLRRRSLLSRRFASELSGRILCVEGMAKFTLRFGKMNFFYRGKYCNVYTYR